MLRTRYAIALALTVGLYGLTSTQLEWTNLSNIDMASVPFVAKSVVSKTDASARLVESSNLQASAWKRVNPSSVFDDSITKPASSEVLTQSIPTVPCLSSPEHEPATWVASASNENPIGPETEPHPVEPLSMNLSDATPLIHSKGVDELFDTYISTPKDTDRPLFPKRIQVQEGDTLSQLCNEVYGMVSAQLLREIMVSNPRLQDENHILKGHWLVFPAPPQDFHKFNSIEKDGNV